MLALDLTPQLNRLIANISAEIAFLQPGTDEGVVPLYSLFSELLDLVKADGGVQDRINVALKDVGDLLDDGGIANPHVIQQFAQLADMLQCFGRYFEMGEPITWDQLEAQWLNEAPTETSTASTPAGAELGNSTIPVGVNDIAAIAAESDVVLSLDLENSRDVLEEFYQEADEHLSSIESALLDLEQDSEDPEAIRSMFRSFHTIKGVAGFLDLTPIRVLAHEIETLMDLMRSGKIQFSLELTDLIFESRDRLKLLMEQIHVGLIEGSQPHKIIPVSDLILRAQIAINDAANVGSSVKAEDTEELEDTLISADAEPSGSSTSAEQTIEDDGPSAPPSSAPSSEAPPSSAPPSEAPRAVTPKKMVASTLRMDTGKLDSVIEAVGELVIVESQLRESITAIHDASAMSSIEPNLRQLSRITRELQNSSLSLRMVSVKPLFQRMQRLARDVASKSGKLINFHVEGEETEMDRTVVEQISDPLIHMIRNSVDHGIELPEDRVKLGKDKMGDVLLKASYIGDSIVLELKDDGGGVSSEKVIKKAIGRGLAQEDVSYTREEVHHFIFQPGFSTAEKVSDFSGRGVGLDVVRSNVQQLRGRIDLDSVEGEGSHMRISLPLTMAIIDGLLVRSGRERYVIPVSTINMTLKPEAGQIFNVQNRGQVIKHREELFSLMHLGDFFGVSTQTSAAIEGIVVMIETDMQDYGLIVDEILHKQEVVIKQLGGSSHTAGISGGAILGDGTVALILDPAMMAQSINSGR